jgi:hypothetical protein
MSVGSSGWKRMAVTSRGWMMPCRAGERDAIYGEAVLTALFRRVYFKVMGSNLKVGMS